MNKPLALVVDNGDGTTTDPYKTPEVFDVVPAEDNPFHNDLNDLVNALARIKTHITYRRQIAVEAYFQGNSLKAIAEKAQYSKLPPIKEWFKKPNSPELEMYRLLQRIHNLRAGPTIEARKHLLWKIAVKTHEDAPQHAIRAVDTLNRMEGIYQHEEQAPAAITNTTVNLNGIDWGELNKVLEGARAQTEPKTIEGERVE
jgi:hypothetical protein